jgi:DNA-binding CsgD family transcriptional regulator
VVKTLPVDRYIVPSHTPHLIIFISNPAEKIEISTRTLMTLYHLTQTEATLTILLAEGKTLDEVSQELNIARNTARAHLRAIFSKTGVTQQSMLVSLVLKSLASIAP